MIIFDVKFHNKDDPVLQNSSQEPSAFSKSGRVLDALLIMLGSLQSSYNSIMTYNIDSTVYVNSSWQEFLGLKNLLYQIYIMNQHCMSFLSCMLIFSSLAWLKVHQEHTHTWRMLMVPDWSFGGLGHLWYQILHHKSTLYVILELYTDFQLHSMIRSVSRTPSYLEEVDASWLELWMIWSALLYWINIICHFWAVYWFSAP